MLITFDSFIFQRFIPSCDSCISQMTVPPGKARDQPVTESELETSPNSQLCLIPHCPFPSPSPLVEADSFSCNLQALDKHL